MDDDDICRDRLFRSLRNKVLANLLAGQEVNVDTIVPAGREDFLQPLIRLVRRTKMMMGRRGDTLPRAESGVSSPSGSMPIEIGPYQVKRLLGEGAFGRVYLAHDERLDRFVAIKVYIQRRYRSIDIEAFRNEGRTLAKLNHPHIVTVYDVGQLQEGSPYLVMNYIDGMSLRDHLRTGSLSVDRSVSIIADVAQAIHYAHREGLVHRDLKPANILISKLGQPYVVDFGIATHEDVQPTLSGQVAGTRDYMSPEQVRGEAHRLDGRADIWALGVVLYEMLTRRLPFTGRTEAELDDAIQHKEPKPPRQVNGQIPLHIEQACLKALSKQISGRFNTALDFAEALHGPPPSKGAYLPSPFDFSPLLKSKREDFVGRQWLLNEIDAWRVADSRERALLITGDPGTGKSAIVAQLVHLNEVDQDHQILAYHCCQADSPATLQPAKFVPSIAAMIARELCDYQSHLDTPSISEALSPVNCENDPANAFDQGILAPLDALPEPENGPRYLLVDALDDSLIIGRGTTIVGLLAARLDRLPRWVRLVATTRNEPKVLQILRHLPAKTLDAQDPRNLDDIRCYIAKRLGTQNLAKRLADSRKSADEVAVELHRLGRGNFLYVRQALDGLETDQYCFDELERLPPRLYGLYHDFFQHHFPDEKSFERCRRVLEVICAAQQPLKREELGAATGLNLRSELPEVLRRMQVYLPHHANADGSEAYQLFHKSLADWLTDPSQQGDVYYIDLLSGHERLAQWCWMEYHCGAATMSTYCSAFLVDHLLGSKRWGDLQTVLTDLRYIESRAMAGATFDLVRQYRNTVDGLPELQHERVRRMERDESLRQYASYLVAFARGHHAGMVVPQAPDSTMSHLRMRCTEAMSADQARCSVKGTKQDPVCAFATFVSSNAHLLHQFPDQTCVIARNHAASGVVVETTESIIRSRLEPFLARDPRPPAAISCPLCLRTLTGHRQAVSCVALTADGKLALSGSRDRTLRAWDMESGACLGVLKGHTQPVSCVALTPDGTTAVSGSLDRTLRVWNIGSEACSRTIEGHTKSVDSVALTPDGRMAVSCSRDGTLRVWEIESGRCLKKLHTGKGRVRSIALAPDATTAVTATGHHTLRVWNLKIGSCQRSRKFLAHNVCPSAFTPDGKTAILANDNHRLTVWNLEGGFWCLAELGVGQSVSLVALTPDAKTAISVISDNTVFVWDVASGECLKSFELSHTETVNSVAMTPDARRLVSASSDKTLRIWDVKSGVIPPRSEGEFPQATSVTLSSDGHAAVSTNGDHSLSVWDVRSGACLRTLVGHKAEVHSVALTPCGSLALSASADCTLRIWDVVTGVCQHTLVGHTLPVVFVASAPDGKTAISASWDDTLRVWDISTGNCLRTLRGHSDTVTSAAWSPDGKIVVSASSDKTLRIWNMDNESSSRIIGDPGEIIDDREGGVCYVALTPNGKFAISWGDLNVLQVWELETGRCLRTMPANCTDKSGRVSPVVALTPDASRMIAPASDGFGLHVWDLETGTCGQTLVGHDDRVSSVVLTPDGQVVVSGSWDRTLRIWDINTGHPIAIYAADVAVKTVAATNNGRIICVGADGVLHFLTLLNWPARTK